MFQALSKANQAQIKAKDATMKVEQARKELEDIAAILSTVEEPGKTEALSRNMYKTFNVFPLLEPQLLDDLARRVEEAERQFQAQDLDLQLRDLEAAKQRQVGDASFCFTHLFVEETSCRIFSCHLCDDRSGC